MKKIIEYKISFHSNEVKKQVGEFLDYYKKFDTVDHSYRVAKEAGRLARGFNVSSDKAYIAGLLHDISVVIPNEERIELHKYLGGNVLKEEEMFPMILHQKQSAFIAKEIFQIDDKEILSAIECHTTLKKNASDLDKVLFLADKVMWDRNYDAPYLGHLKEALNISLDEGCRVYIEWALSDIIVLHPWLKDAIDDLNEAVI